MSAKFGPAGLSDELKSLKTDIIKLPEILRSENLDCFEYQCGHGVSVTKDRAERIKEECSKNGISVSLHAPYYISLSSIEPDKREKSVEYILNSAFAVKYLGGNRIVVHSGSCSKISRAEALSFSKKTLIRARKELDLCGLNDICICPETMGKLNQLGTLEEVIELCKIDERFIPCVDFGHLNARTLGKIKNKKDYEVIIDIIKNELGTERYNRFHAHFSKIQFTEKGEKCHLTFNDAEYGPDYNQLCDVLAERGISPTVICESAGTQMADAKIMKMKYTEALR